MQGGYPATCNKKEFYMAEQTYLNSLTYNYNERLSSELMEGCGWVITESIHLHLDRSQVYLDQCFTS